MNVINILRSVLKNPFTVLGSAGLGLYCGANFPEFTALVSPFGIIFLSMLQMVSLPIILCAVISGLGSLLYSGLARETMRRFMMILIFAPLFAAAIGLFSGVIFEPGVDLPPDAESTFGEMMINDSYSSDSTEVTDSSFWSFAQQIVTENIFVSLVDGRPLQVLFFSILIGIALGLEKKKSNETALAIIEAVFEALLKIINWLIYFLPFGLFALLAAQAENINLTSLLAMLNLAAVYAGGCLLLFITCNILIVQRTGVSYSTALSAFREAILVSASSANSFAALPSALRGMQHTLKLDRRTTDLMTPLSLNLLPLATIIYFSVAALFIAQISAIELTLIEYITLFFGSILAGLAAASLPSAAGVAVIAIVLEPLGLPVEVAIVLLIAIDPILDPINAAVDTHVACTVATLVADPPTKDIE